MTDPSDTIEVDSLEEAYEAMYRLGWTADRPSVPPTVQLVHAVLDYLGREPQEVIGQVPPQNRIATVEKLAVNSITAGSSPVPGMEVVGSLF